MRHQLESHREAWREESQERWRAVLHALEAAKTIPPAAPSTMFGRPIQDVVPALVSALEARRQSWQGERESSEGLAARCDELQRRTRSLENEIGVGKAVRRYASAVRSKLRRIGLRKP